MPAKIVATFRGNGVMLRVIERVPREIAATSRDGGASFRVFK